MNSKKIWGLRSGYWLLVVTLIFGLLVPPTPVFADGTPPGSPQETFRGRLGTHLCSDTRGCGGLFWGKFNGQTGKGITSLQELTPVTAIASGATAVSSGENHTCALLDTGAVKCWGQNSDGQTGKGITGAPELSPVTAISSGAIAVSAGLRHTCALLDTGAVQCWGYNSFGQTGKGITSSQERTPVTAIFSGAIAVSAGYSHTCALLDTGAVQCWGYNSYGQTGKGITSLQELTPVTAIASGATAVGSGNGHTCALLDTGAVQCWGKNDLGQTGNGNTTSPQLTPFTVFASGATAVSVGYNHTCALLDTGAVQCWGKNNYGQTGSGNTTTLQLAKVTAIASGATAVSAGYNHTCALLDTGTVNCWGYNIYGQTGSGDTTTPQLIPVTALYLDLSDSIPPTNPTVITESHGVLDGVWQDEVNAPSFSWSGASDASGIAGYEVAWGTDANAETGSYQTETTYTPAAVTTGTYYLRIRTKDASEEGNYSAWFTAFIFRYDNSAPAQVEVSSVVETHGITYGAESSVSRPSFTWTVPGDAGSGVAGYNVYFGNYLDGTSSDLVVESNYTVTTAATGNEIYYLRLQTVDEAGNVSSWRTVFLYEYVPGAAPANVGSVTEINGYENDTWHGLSQNTPTFSWVSPDVAVIGYNVYWGMDANGTDGIYQTTLTYTPGIVATDGTYYLRIQTKDDTEQVSPWTTLYTYKFDGSIPANVTYPVLEINGAVNNTCQDSVRRPAFSWNKPNDFGSGVSAYRAYFGKSLDEVILPEATTIYTEGFALNNDVAGGFYALRLQAIDASGNASDWQLAYVYCYASASGYVTSTTSLELTTSLPDDPDGQLVVELPADMYDDTLQVLIYPVAERVGIPAQFSVVGNQFEIEAISQTTNENVTQFDQEYTISYHYNDEDILGLDETTLKVYYHNPVSGEWEALASSTVDTVNNIVSATIDHMSEFAIFGTIAIGDANITVLSGGAPNILDSLITFETKTLTGEIQQALGSIAEPWVAKDPSGSGNGWHVEIAASDFISGSHSIAISNAQIKQSPSNISLVYGNVIPSSTQESFTPLGSTPVKLLTAAQDTGMGTYNFSPEFTLTIPANAFAGTYLAPVTLSIITAP